MTPREEVELAFDCCGDLEKEHDDNLSNGRCFVAGDHGIDRDEVYDLVLVAPGGDRFTLQARAVHVMGGARPGTGFEIVEFDHQLKAQLAAFVKSAGRFRGPAAEDLRDDGRRPLPKNVTQRLRGLSPAEQAKVAREGEVHERKVLERIYGKAVWEALLGNPRLTHPEVARIARMRSLPLPQLETIVGNARWLNNAQVRRALLSNVRLTRAMSEKVLRATPKHELKLVTKQTAYPPAVREAARRMLRTGG